MAALGTIEQASGRAKAPTMAPAAAPARKLTPPRLVQLEADLRFCEDVLHSKTPLPAVPARAGGIPVHFAQPGATPSSGGDAAAAQLAKQRAQHSSLLKRAPSPPSIHHMPGAGGAAIARTTDELLSMMTSVPEGQPFEIDARLLYSPQSSCAGDADSSPGSHDSQAWEELLRQHQADPGAGAGGDADSFSLAAYRPATASHQPRYTSIGHAAAALSPMRDGSYHLLADSGPGPEQRSQQHAPGPPSGTQQQWQQTHVRRQHVPGLSARSCTSAARPASALLRGSGPSNQGAARQLNLGVASPSGSNSRAYHTAEPLQKGRGNHHTARLAQPRTSLWQRCARIRAQEEDAELRECTFRPKTGRAPAQQRLAPGMPVEERLHLAQAGRREALERARSQRDREQLSHCTFAPQLVTQPGRLLRKDYAPLHQRLGQEQRRRGVSLAQAHLRRDLAEADLTFQPQLNQRSLQLAAECETRQLDGEQPLAAGCRPAATQRAPGGGAASDGRAFVPAINTASKRMLEDSATVPSDFQERLQYYSLQKQLRQRAAAEAADADACTFRPNTGNAVQVLALSASRAGNLLESAQERYDRMAGKEAGRLAARRAAKEAEVYEDLLFTPHLNPRSLALAPAGSGGAHGLAGLADQQQQRLQQLRQKEEERQRAQCTFKPNTSKPRVMGYYQTYQPPQPHALLSIKQPGKQGFEGLTQRIADYQAEKEARLAAVKSEEQAKQLVECSFMPDINRRQVQAQGPVAVRGLDRYLELKQLAEHQKTVADERAAKVFNLNPRAKQGATVPQPFQLAGHSLLEARAAEKKTALLQSTLSQRRRDCTFRPETNHQRRQEQLHRMLGQPAVDDSDAWVAAGLEYP